VTFVSFVTLFIVYFSSMYSRCDLSTGIFYTNIWIWIWNMEMRYYVSASNRNAFTLLL